MNSDFLRLSRRVSELEKGSSKDTGSFLRNDSRFLNSLGEVELGSNIAHSLRGGSNSTSSSGFPTTYGQYWHFSGSSRPRDLTLWTKNGGENLYFQTYAYPDGNPQGWNQIWHSGNFNPSNYLRSDTNDTYSGGLLRLYTQAGVTIQTSPASTTQFDTLQIYQQTAGADALMTFHVGGDYAVHFGLDGSRNDLVVGGWSKGAVSYKLWHEGNDGTGSGLDADRLDGYHGSYSAVGSTYALRDSAADIHCRLLRPNYSNQSNIYGAIAFRGNNSSDNYVRFCSSPSAVCTWVGALPLSGGTMAGGIHFDNMSTNPYISGVHDYIFVGLDGSSKVRMYSDGRLWAASTVYEYGASLASRYLSLSGGTITGDVSMSNKDITSLNRIVINDAGEAIAFWDSTFNGTHYLHMDADGTHALEFVFQNANYDIQMGDAYDSGYSECSIFPSTDGKGNCGTPLKTWSQCVRLTGTTGSSRDRKELIRMFDTERAYDTVKDTLIYSFKYKTEHDPEEIAKMEALGREVHDTNWFNLGVMADQAPLEILNTYTADDTHINIDNSIFLTMAALQHAQERIEILEQRVEELENGVT